MGSVRFACAGLCRECKEEFVAGPCRECWGFWDLLERDCEGPLRSALRNPLPSGGWLVALNPLVALA